MRIVIKNMIRSVKSHPKENTVILLNMTLCMMTVFVLLQNYYFLKDHFDLVYGNDQVAKRYRIEMNDNDKQAMLSDRLNRSPMYYVGQKVDKEIMDLPHLYLYYNMYTDIPLNEFADKEQLRRYSSFDELSFRESRSEDKDDYTYINVMIVSEYCEKAFNLKTMSGRFFEKADYGITDRNKPIPVVLGNDYAEMFSVGDIIELRNDTAVVIGILEDNMFISGDGAVEYLDRFILTSSSVIPRTIENSADELARMDIYDQLYCDDPDIDVQKEINRITAENGYYTYRVFPVDGVEISETKNISEKNVRLIGLLALIAGVICTCSLSSVLYNRSVQDRSIFCVYMCCGVPLWKINVSIVMEMSGYLMISFLPICALSIIEYKKLMVPAWQIFMFSGILMLVSMIPVFMINRKNDLDMLIRDKIV